MKDYYLYLTRFTFRCRRKLCVIIYLAQELTRRRLQNLQAWSFSHSGHNFGSIEGPSPPPEDFRIAKC